MSATQGETVPSARLGAPVLQAGGQQQGPALGAEQGWLTPGDGASHAQACDCSSSRAIHGHSPSMGRPKLGQATSSSLINSISWCRPLEGKPGSGRGLPTFATWHAAFSLRKRGLLSISVTSTSCQWGCMHHCVITAEVYPTQTYVSVTDAHINSSPVKS